MKIILPHNHDHAGVIHKAGTEFEFSEEQYAWFIQATMAIRSGDRAYMRDKIGTAEWAEAVLEQARPEEIEEPVIEPGFEESHDASE